jgi:cytochrome c oxidase subunit II
MIKTVSRASVILFLIYFIVLFIKVPMDMLPNGEMPITSFIDSPATPIAKLVQENFWYTFLHMLPYLLISEGLLIFCIFRFREGNGRVAATFHENLKLEVFWTIVPFISVIAIAWPTFDLLDKMNTPESSDLEVQVTGQRFSFRYKYLEHDITIVSTDEEFVVPANKNVTLSMTSVDVLHAWWVPAFGVKYDLVPGRTTQIWFNAIPGTYKGQCAELCGASHADMLIAVKVLPENEFLSWIKKKKDEKAALVSLVN